MTAGESTCECDACRRIMGLWQAAFTSECGHTFHLRCVSGAAACPLCAAPWTHIPAAAPAPAPATPFTFTDTGVNSPPPSSIAHNSRASPPCAVCHAAMRAGQATVTSECSHTFHLRCIASHGARRSACPVCTARWRDCVSLAPPPPETSSSSLGGAHPQPQSPLTTASRYGELSGGAHPPPQLYAGIGTGRIPQLPTTARCPSCLCLTAVTWFGQTESHDSSSSNMLGDDEPVEEEEEVEVVEPPPSPLDQQQAAVQATNKDDADGGGGVAALALTAHCEHRAVARDTARDSFAVLVHAKALSSSAAPPLDLVAAVDVSGSMARGNNKLALLKQAMSLLIDRHLGPRDRLGIVAFAREARLVLRLARMSDAGKATARAAVESLLVAQAQQGGGGGGGGTDVGGGLRAAAQVLDGRRRCRHRSAVAGVVLLSDGKHNRSDHRPDCVRRVITRCGGLVPRSLRCNLGSLHPPPVHMLGLGADAEAEALRDIAMVTRGTLSIIGDKQDDAATVMEDSLARCLGGLRSVAAQEARVVVECLHPGVHVRAVKLAGGAGYCPRRIDAGGRAASVDVGELHAGEERRFLLFLGVPVAGAGEDGGGGMTTTRLVKVRCTYKDAATGRSVAVCCEDDVAVQRPVVVPVPAPATATEVEVARQRFRTEAAEDVGFARGAADGGDHKAAVQILDRRLEASAAVGLALAGDDRCAALVAELRALRGRVVADWREYEQKRRALPPAFGTRPAAGSTVRVPFRPFGGSTGPATPAFGS